MREGIYTKEGFLSKIITISFLNKIRFSEKSYIYSSIILIINKTSIRITTI